MAPKAENQKSPMKKVTHDEQIRKNSLPLRGERRRKRSGQ